MLTHVAGALTIPLLVCEVELITRETHLDLLLFHADSLPPVQRVSLTARSSYQQGGQTDSDGVVDIRHRCSTTPL